MAQAASINFQKITSTLHAVGHASRQVPPSYLMPADKSIGAHCLIDDKGEVHKTYKAKLALASRQAKKEEGYSPLWEGVLNLPDKLETESWHEYLSRCVEAVFKWRDEYQKMTQHKVLRADLHLDEGHINEAGEIVFNPHAHIMCDRTNDAGRVIKIDRAGMRRIQTMTAEVTGLKRGEDARITRRKHINAHAYKSLAESNRLETQQEIKKARDKGYKEGYEFARQELEIQYKREREALKASGLAIQSDYQKLKLAYSESLRKIKESQDLFAFTLKERARELELISQERDAALTKSIYLDIRRRLMEDGFSGDEPAKLGDYIALKKAANGPNSLEKMKQLDSLWRRLDEELVQPWSERFRAALGLPAAGAGPEIAIVPVPEHAGFGTRWWHEAGPDGPDGL